MAYNVIATAPTVFQYASLVKFGMPIKRHLDGSFSAKHKFDTLQEALDFLYAKAVKYCNDEKGQLEKEYTKGEWSLRIDGAYAQIEEDNSHTF